MEHLAVVTLSETAVDEALFQADIPDGTYALVPVAAGSTVTAEKRKACTIHGFGGADNPACEFGGGRNLKCDVETLTVVREVV